jgi:hypothetical protein
MFDHLLEGLQNSLKLSFGLLWEKDQTQTAEKRYLGQDLGEFQSRASNCLSQWDHEGCSLLSASMCDNMHDTANPEVIRALVSRAFIELCHTVVVDCLCG